jgi:hypothetical protein
MAGGSVSNLDPVTEQTPGPAEPKERPDGADAASLTPPAEAQSAIRSAYVAHLSHADTGAGATHDVLAGSMTSAYVSRLSQADTGAGGAHDLPAASMVRAIYVDRIAAEAMPRAAAPKPGRRAAPISPKRKAAKKKKASASPARRRKAKTAASSGKRRARRPRR